MKDSPFWTKLTAAGRSSHCCFLAPFSESIGIIIIFNRNINHWTYDHVYIILAHSWEVFQVFKYLSILVSHIVDNTVYLSAENQAKAVKTAFSTKWEAKWSILAPGGYLRGPQSGPKSLMFIHSSPMRCFGIIWSFSVHHLGSFVISSSRTLYFGTSEVVTLNT